MWSVDRATVNELNKSQQTNDERCAMGSIEKRASCPQDNGINMCSFLLSSTHVFKSSCWSPEISVQFPSYPGTVSVSQSKLERTASRSVYYLYLVSNYPMQFTTESKRLSRLATCGLTAALSHPERGSTKRNVDGGRKSLLFRNASLEPAG